MVINKYLKSKVILINNKKNIKIKKLFKNKILIKNINNKFINFKNNNILNNKI